MQHGRAIAHVSRRLNPNGLNYPTHDLELAAVILALKPWRHLIVRSQVSDLHRSQESSIPFYPEGIEFEAVSLDGADWVPILLELRTTGVELEMDEVGALVASLSCETYLIRMNSESSVFLLHLWEKNRGILALGGSHPGFTLGMDGTLCFRTSWWFLVFQFWETRSFDGGFLRRFWQGIRVVRRCIVLFENIVVAKLGVGFSCFCE